MLDTATSIPCIISQEINLQVCHISTQTFSLNPHYFYTISQLKLQLKESSTVVPSLTQNTSPAEYVDEDDRAIRHRGQLPLILALFKTSCGLIIKIHTILQTNLRPIRAWLGEGGTDSVDTSSHFLLHVMNDLLHLDHVSSVLLSVLYLPSPTTTRLTFIPLNKTTRC